jgi:hypothetical protein
VGLEPAALKPWVNSAGDITPQPDLCGEQRVSFEPAQLPSLFTELRERSSRGASEPQSQLLIRQEAADDSFNSSMCQGKPF